MRPRHTQPAGGAGVGVMNGDASVPVIWVPHNSVSNSYFSEFPIAEEAAFGIVEQLLKYLW